MNILPCPHKQQHWIQAFGSLAFKQILLQNWMPKWT